MFPGQILSYILYFTDFRFPVQKDYCIIQTKPKLLDNGRTAIRTKHYSSLLFQNVQGVSCSIYDDKQCYSNYWG